MGIISDEYASWKLLAKELAARGYTVSETYVEETQYVTYKSPKGALWRTRGAHLTYPITSKKAQLLAKDKDAATHYVVESGGSAPATLKLTGSEEDEQIQTFLGKYGKVVVKPLDRSLSLGLTTDITTLTKAKKAIKAAAEFSKTVLMQQQVFGEEIRFTVLDGKVVSALLRRTPRVIGDGVSTIAELIDQENEARAKIDYTLVKYPQLTGKLIRKSVDLTRIPDTGEVVELSRSTMIGRGCSAYDVLEKVDPSYLKIVEKVVKGLGAGFIVVDIFVEDFRQPATMKNHWFIEFNTAPVLKLFYSCRDGNMHDILPMLAGAIDRKIHMTSGKTLGCFEVVSLPGLGVSDQFAKIDSGAYSGALHCSGIKVVRRGPDKRRILKFTPLGDPDLATETETFLETSVRSASGHLQKRYIIDTEVIIQGSAYPIRIGLSDRSEMKRPILIGRRFLRENNMLVDVRINEEYDDEGENTK